MKKNQTCLTAKKKPVKRAANRYRTSSFTNYERIASLLPLLIYSIWIIFMHHKLSLGWGDDPIFKEFTQEPGYTWSGWLLSRYMTWSSRSIIEGILIILASSKGIYWRVLNSLMLITLSFVLSYLFIPKKQELLGNIFLVMLLTSLDYSIMSKATGWIATTTNYLWPLVAALITLISIKKMWKNVPIGIFSCIIYTLSVIFAVNSEQICVCMILICIVSIFLFKIKKQRIPIFLWLLTFVSVAGIVNVLLCPGNTQRGILEVRWLPGYDQYSIIHKVILGISSTIRYMFYDNHIPIWIFTLVLAFVSLKRLRSPIQIILGIVPAFVLIGGNIIQFISDKMDFYMTNDFVVEAIKKQEYTALILFILDILVCGIILLDFYFIFKKDLVNYLIGAGAFVLGLMTKAMLGFSPTIWASYDRTGIIGLFAFFIATLTLVKEMDMPDWPNVVKIVFSIGLGFLTCIFMYWNTLFSFI